MVAKRIIPCLDVLNGRTVKGVHFKDLADVGDPVELGVKYARERADELVYLDISATVEGRRTFTELVSMIAESIDIPFTVGGGIGSLEDASRLLDAGADKITVNSAAIRDPSLIDALAAKYGSQFVTVAIDAKEVGHSKKCAASAIDAKEAGHSKKCAASAIDADWCIGSENAGESWMCAVKGGREMTDKELFSWALEAERRGAGEILFTSMDNDGTRNGYPCETYARLAEELTIPVIASGGAGSVQDIADVLTIGKADAALAASIFHYGMMTIGELKRRLIERNIEIRL